MAVNGDEATVRLRLRLDRPDGTSETIEETWRLRSWEQHGWRLAELPPFVIGG